MVSENRTDFADKFSLSPLAGTDKTGKKSSKKGKALAHQKQGPRHRKPAVTHEGL
jgi:hypothetical protein